VKIEQGKMVPLDYGKYFRSDSIVGLEPIQEGRSPGKRTRVYIENLSEPVIASRSEGALLRDLVALPRAVTCTREQQGALHDILDAIGDINPMLRSIIRDQGRWDLDRLEERLVGLKALLRDTVPGQPQRNGDVIRCQRALLAEGCSWPQETLSLRGSNPFVQRPSKSLHLVHSMLLFDLTIWRRWVLELRVCPRSFTVKRSRAAPRQTGRTSSSLYPLLAHKVWEGQSDPSGFASCRGIRQRSLAQSSVGAQVRPHAASRRCSQKSEEDIQRSEEVRRIGGDPPVRGRVNAIKQLD
jgi:hypothetical protein